MMQDNAEKPKRPRSFPWRLFFSQLVDMIMWGILVGVGIGFGYGLLFFLIGALVGVPLGAATDSVVGAITGVVFNFFTIRWYYPLRSQAQAYEYLEFVPGPCALVAAVSCPIVGTLLISLRSGRLFELAFAPFFIIPALATYPLARSTLRRMTRWYVQGFPFAAE